MASTRGAVDLSTLDAADRKVVESWVAAHRGMEDDLRKRGIHPAAGERMAREQPTLEFLYREIDRLSIDLDKEALRTKLEAVRTLPASNLKQLMIPVLFITGTEDVIFPPPAATALARLVPGPKLNRFPKPGILFISSGLKSSTAWYLSSLRCTKAPSRAQVPNRS